MIIPQLKIELDREALARYGLTPHDVNEFIETALSGRVVSTVIQGQRKFDLLVSLGEEDREDVDNLQRLIMTLPDDRMIPLGAVATIRRRGGPNAIQREQVQRRIVVQRNTTGLHGLVSAVGDIRKRLAPIE